MGIKGLMKLIKTFAPDSISDKDYSSYENMKLAIDMPLLIYKFVIAIRNRGQDLTNKQGKITSHIYGILNKFINMLKYGSIPVPVFDGEPPVIKKETLLDRKNKKEQALSKLHSLSDDSSDDKEKIKLYKRSYYITNEHYRDIKTLIKLLGFVVVDAPQEADAQCAALNISGFVDGVVSEDMDTLVFGASTMIRNFSNRNSVIEIDLNKLLSGFDISFDQFIDISIILGSDYCKCIKGISPVDVVNFYKKTGNIKKFVEHLENINSSLIHSGKKPKYFIPPDFFDRWFQAKQYYQHVKVKHPDYFNNVVWNKPDFDGLFKFLCIDNGFDESKTRKQLNYILSRYNYYIKHNSLNIDKSIISSQSAGFNNKFNKSFHNYYSNSFYSSNNNKFNNNKFNNNKFNNNKFYPSFNNLNYQFDNSKFSHRSF